MSDKAVWREFLDKIVEVTAADRAERREFLDKIVEALDDLSIGDLTEYGCLERIRRLVDQELAARRKASA